MRYDSLGPQLIPGPVESPDGIRVSTAMGQCAAKPKTSPFKQRGFGRTSPGRTFVSLAAGAAVMLIPLAVAADADRKSEWDRPAPRAQDEASATCVVRQDRDPRPERGLGRLGEHRANAPGQSSHAEDEDAHRPGYERDRTQPAVRSRRDVRRDERGHERARAWFGERRELRRGGDARTSQRERSGGAPAAESDARDRHTRVPEEAEATRRGADIEHIGGDLAHLEREIFEITNEVRRQHDLEPVSWSRELGQAARHHAADMASHGYFSHDTYAPGVDGDLEHVMSAQQRARAFGISGGMAENIAFNRTERAERVVEQWLGSEGHRRNLLDPDLRTLGVGHYQGYWVQNFGY